MGNRRAGDDAARLAAVGTVHCPLPTACRLPPTARRRAFSLLEVILALAILTGAVAVLGELARLGTRNARIARDTAKAQLLCETVLAEILSGMIAPEATQASSFTQDLDPNYEWSYSVDVQSLDMEGLLSVQVTVRQNLPEAAKPMQVSLVRWMIDPNATTAQSSTSSASSSSSSSSSSTGGGS